MKKYILIIAVFFAAGISGCKKDYLSLEKNPNTPSVTTPQLTLSAALNATASIIVNNYNEYGVWSGYWTTSGNYVPNQQVNQYQFTNGSFQASWINWYANLTNYNILQTVSAKDPSLAYYKAMAMVMTAYGFSHLVDEYNDVPYSQAFQLSTITFPAFDKGSDIYADLFKKLDAAIAILKGPATGLAAVGSEDILFHGDVTKWAQFANTLKLRMAMRVSSANGFDAASIMATTATAADAPDAEANFLGLSTQAAVNPGYSDVAGKQNPFWASFGFDPTGNPVFGNVYYRANDFAVKFMQLNADPRASRFYAPNGPGNIRGNIFGDPGVQSNTFTSAIGPGLLKSPTQDAVILSGAESLFLQAEAVQRGFLTGDAQGLYEAGITASFEALGVGATTAASDAAAAAYYGQSANNVGWAASANKEQAIITQKWLALNGYFNFEGYNEYRRTGFPVLPSSIDPAAISQTLPTRLPYPLEELVNNQANLAKEGSINSFSTKIFWAK